MLKNLTIKKKLFVLAVLVAASLFILLVVQSVGIKKIEQLESLSAQSYQAEVDMLMLRRNEKDFLSRLDLKYQQSFNDNIQSMLTRLLEFEAQLNNLPEQKALAEQLIDVINQYGQVFNQLVETGCDWP
jgi:methyl-accepting chemotaxis protein